MILSKVYKNKSIEYKPIDEFANDSFVGRELGSFSSFSLSSCLCILCMCLIYFIIGYKLQLHNFQIF